MKPYILIIALSTALACTLSAAPASAANKITQTLKATVNGTVFESDDDGITYLIPTKGVLNLIATTKGASAYPPPKALSDRLSINCRGFELAPITFSAKDFDANVCEARFYKGESRKPFGDPEAEFSVAKGKNMLEITSVKGKIIEGTFSFEMQDKKTKAKLTVIEGTFKAEDRQL
jgi:hypothetical protein